jgi:histidine triad (HIT) family protein
MMMTNPDCLFCKIVLGKVEANIVYENDRVIAFRDINPQAPTHVLIIPRDHTPTINDLTRDTAGDVGELFLAARDVAKQEGVEESGYRVVMNCMEGAGQSVFHIHLHLLAGRRLQWPPG